MNRNHIIREIFFKGCVNQQITYKSGQDFISFSGALEEILQPVYQSAKNCGFKDWIYKDMKDH